MASNVQLLLLALVGATIAICWGILKTLGGDSDAVAATIHVLALKLGPWAMPVFVLVHAISLAVCFPYAMAFEAAASFLFGFTKGVVCIFCAKVSGAALAFWIGRTIFNSSVSARAWVRKNKYFAIVNRGVAEEGWKFVLMARFSPIPSYIINYALAATDARFFVDFLLPTLFGGVPMILQNASFGSLTSAATVGHGSTVLSYVLPSLGLISGMLVSWRMTKYVSMDFAEDEVIKLGGKTDGELLAALKKTTALGEEDESQGSVKPSLLSNSE